MTRVHDTLVYRNFSDKQLYDSDKSIFLSHCPKDKCIRDFFSHTECMMYIFGYVHLIN